jgi:hypothetical protein
METGSTHDVPPEQYPNLIRAMIRHEDEVTNHRIMWLLVFQGFLANALAVSREEAHLTIALGVVGSLVTLSAFVTLYKSYHARGYLKFLGTKAKLGRLPEKYMQLDGWPENRIKNWQQKFWVCSYFEQFRDLLEPYLFLPALTLSIWNFLLLREWVTHSIAALLSLALILTAFILTVFCTMWLWLQRKELEDFTDEPVTVVIRQSSDLSPPTPSVMK